MRKLIIHTDGAARGNPGPAAAAFTVEEAGQKIAEGAKTIGETTNNIAEYTAVNNAFDKLKEILAGERVEVEVLMDSNLVASQLRGDFKIKNAGLKPIFEAVKLKELEFGSVTYIHIPREQNSLADSLANKALDSVD